MSSAAKHTYEGYTSIDFERLDDVLRIRIANPRNELNAVDGELHAELARLFDELKGEREARAIVLTGSGSAFSAGGDLNWAAGLGAADLDELRRHGKQLIWGLLDVELPIVAAINGPAVGLGATIALLCDTIYIAESAIVADPHVRVGVVAGDGGAVAWPMAVGPARAKRYLMTGDPVDAREAERIGLVNEVVADDELERVALEFARRLAEGAPLAVRLTKLAVNQLVKQQMAVAFDHSLALELMTFASEDRSEALIAFKERRKPRFTGS